VRPRPVALSAYYFASYAALGVYLPYFPRWLEARGVTGLAMGAVAATLPAMGLVGPPLVGIAADALALRTELLRACASSAFGAFAVVAVAALVGRPLSYVELLAAVLLFALFRAPTTPLADVVALELSRPGASKRPPSYGQLRLWGSLGFLVAAVLAGRYLDATATAPLPVAIAAGYFGAALATFSLPAEARAPSRPVAGEARALLASRDVRWFLVASVLAQAAHSAYDLCFTLHLRDRGVAPGLVGFAWAVGVVAEIALMAAPSRLLARRRPAALLAFALGGASVRWALVATVRSPALLLALQPLHALSFALMWLASLAFVRERAPAHALATAQGLFVASTSAGSVLGMLAWGPLYRAYGGAATFGAASIVALAACACAVVFARAPAVVLGSAHSH
jgi:PPP family 3-phenylpropionic acid transporter